MSRLDKREVKREGRKICYSVLSCEEDHNESGPKTLKTLFVTAPLGATQDFVENFTSVMETGLQVVAVGQPGMGGTDLEPVACQGNSPNPQTHRLLTFANDALAVLQKEKVRQVQIMSLCLGHPYGAALAYTLLNHASTQHCGMPKLQFPLILVAPWVAIAPNGSHMQQLAQFGNSLPNLVKDGMMTLLSPLIATSTSSVSSLPHSMVARSIRSSMTDQEAQLWSEAELGDMASKVGEMAAEVSPSQSANIRIATDQEWYDAIVAPLVSALQEVRPPCSNASKHPTVKIYAADNDDMTSLESVQWLVDNVYGELADLTVLRNATHSNTLSGGGPPRNQPVYKHIYKHDLNRDPVENRSSI